MYWANYTETGTSEKLNLNSLRWSLHVWPPAMQLGLMQPNSRAQQGTPSLSLPVRGWVTLLPLRLFQIWDDNSEKLMVNRMTLKLQWLRASAGWKRKWVVPSTSTHVDESNNFFSLSLAKRNKAWGFHMILPRICGSLWKAGQWQPEQHYLYIMKTFCCIPVGCIFKTLLHEMNHQFFEGYPCIPVLVHGKWWTGGWEYQTASVKLCSWCKCKSWCQMSWLFCGSIVETQETIHRFLVAEHL